jgi:hypothetical protein
MDLFPFMQKILASEKVIPVLNEAPRHEDVCANGGIVARMLNIGNRWRWVVSYMPRLLYPRDKRPQYPLDRGWLDPRGELEAVEKRKASCLCSESNPDSSVVQLVITMPTEASRPLCQGQHFPFSHWLLKYMKCRGLAFILPPPYLFRAPVRHGD